MTLGPELDYVLVEGPARDGKRVLLVLAERAGRKRAGALWRRKRQRARPCEGRRTGDASCRRSAGRRDALLHESKGIAAAAAPAGLRHPFYDREIPIILGDHVSAEDGTGAVHTAPGHGVEDFAVGQKYGLVEKYSASELNPVGANGVYLPGTPIFAGQYIWKANDTIIALLAERGVLLAHAKITHSYPHCWRHRTPVAFRATPQWFIGMDDGGLRKAALQAIRDDVTWYPGWGEERIAGMIAGRPDWCISRQRTWGVPIALFVDKANKTPHPRSVELMEEVAQRVEKDGVDAWYALDRGGTSRQRGRAVRESHRHPRCLVRLRRHPLLRARPAREPRTQSRRQGDVSGRLRPAPRLVPLVAADLGGHARSRAVRRGADPRLHRRCAGPQDVQVARQRHRAAGRDEQVRRRHPASVDRVGRLPQRDVAVGRDPETRRRFVSAHPQHRALPARQS